jgi:uncharacterized protein with HEPN domain
LNKRDHRDFLLDLVQYAETAVQLVDRLTAESVISDVRTRLALERALEIVGEAAGKVPDAVRDRYPDVPWAQMSGLRNRLAHAYFGIDHVLLHRVASELLPPLLPRLRDVAALEGAGGPHP